MLNRFTLALLALFALLAWPCPDGRAAAMLWHRQHLASGLSFGRVERASPLRVPATGSREEQPAAPARPEPRLRTDETEHFRFFVPPGVSTESLRSAEEAAEAGFVRVQRFFSDVQIDRRIDVRLDADFEGATAYAIPGAERRGGTDLIAIRFEDLDVLGLRPSFLFPHELTHLFAYRWASDASRAARSMMSGGVMGEGLADYVAGGLDGLGLEDWWPRLFEREGLWEDPMARFVKGDNTDPHPNRTTLALRVAHYDEPALLIKYLIDRYGKTAFHQFYVDYNSVLGDAFQAAQHHRARYDPSRVEAVFQRDLGEAPEVVFKQWQARIDRSSAPPETERRVLLAHQIYASVQEFERASRAHPPDGETRAQVRKAFRSANAAFWKGDLNAAERALTTARRLAKLPPASQGPVEGE